MAHSWREAATALPGEETFARVCAARPEELKSEELPDLIVTVDRLISQLHAVQAAAVAEFARPGRAGTLESLVDTLTYKAGFALGVDGTVDAARLELLLAEQARVLAGAGIAAALHQSPIGAGRRIDAALELVDELPETWAALRDGLIDVPRARVIAERTRNLPGELRRRVQCAVLPLAGSRTPGQLIPMIDRRVIAQDPTAAFKRCQRARKDRCVDYLPGADGMGTVRAYLPADGAVSVYDLLDGIARATAGTDARPLAARRADALVDVCVELLTTGRLDLGDVLAPNHGTDSEPNQKDAAVAVTPDERCPFDRGQSDVGARPGENAANEDVPNEEFFNETRPGGTGPEDAPPPTGAGVEEALIGAGPEGAGPERARPENTCSENPGPEAPEAAVSGAVASGTVAPAEPSRFGSQLSPIGKQHGRGAHFNLTMSIEAFLGLNDDAAELAGHGSVPAPLARLLKKSARSIAVVTVDGNGHAVAIGATVYAPNQVITDQVVTAAATCRFPSCRVPAVRCDLDHRLPFDPQQPDRGGRTEPSNLDPLCRKHHLLKTHAGWSAVRSPDDGLTMIWTSPTGHRYLDEPREFTLPNDERRLLPKTPPANADADLERHDAFDDDCVCGARAVPLTDNANVGPTQAERIRLLIETKERKEAEAEAEQERRRLNLPASPVWMYRLGLQKTADDRTSDDVDIADYVDYQPPTEAFMKRFCPGQYARERAASHAAEHPDPALPPF